MALQLKFKQAQNVTEAQALLSAASAELSDAIQVLEEDHLHPNRRGFDSRRDGGHRRSSARPRWRQRSILTSLFLRPFRASRSAEVVLG